MGRVGGPLVHTGSLHSPEGPTPTALDDMTAMQYLMGPTAADEGTLAISVPGETNTDMEPYKHIHKLPQAAARCHRLS